MKLFKIGILLVAVLCSTSLTSFAQQDKNEVVVSIGAASSLTAFIANTAGGQDVTTSPAVNASIDLGMNERFSLGLAYCFQSFNMKTAYYNPLGYGTVQYGESIYQRHNAGVRFLFHFSKRKDVDFYSGIRLSYLFHQVQENRPPGYVNNYSNADFLGGKKNRYCQQIVMGGKYYWNETFGVLCELGIGFPYVFNVGLNMRLQ